MFGTKCRNTSKQIRRNGYYAMVAGLFWIGAVVWLNCSENAPVLGADLTPSVHVLTKARPVIGEWIYTATPELLRRIVVSDISIGVLVLGIVALMGGAASLENAKLVERVEKLEATLAAREQPVLK